MNRAIKKLYKKLFNREIYIVATESTVKSVWKDGVKASKESYYTNQVCGNCYTHVEKHTISR